MGPSPTESRSVKRLAVMAPDAPSLLRQRGELLAEVLARRHAVLALVPERHAAALPSLEQRGFSVATYALGEPEPRLIADGKAIKAITSVLADWQAHVLLGYGAKSMALGAIAGRKAGVSRRVGLVTTLPPFMAADGQAVPGWSWRRLMKAGFKALDAVVFQNRGQEQRLQALGLVPPGLPAVTVAGAGVDLVRNVAAPLPALAIGGAPALNFAMIARKDAEAGVIEFCKAARLVRDRAPQTRFVVAGPDGGLPAGLLQRYEDCVQFTGDLEDVRPLLAASHVMVAPGWTGGPPRVLLEALAAGRPVITCDVAGCREAVDERVNGVLVPPRDAAALAEAMTSFLKRPDLIPAMARASRDKAERRFDVRAVNAAMLDVLGL